jgi:hypothetical protein
MSEVRRSASYYGSSSTEKKSDIPSNADAAIDVREVSLSMNVGDNVSNNNIQDISIQDILKTGVIIAVKFTHASSPIKTTEIKDDQDVITSISHNGRKLSLQINNNTKPVYLGSDIIGWNNPFEWKANSTIHFIYNEDKNGYWTVTDSGAYSNITQTADAIKLEVSSGDGANRSLIT